MIRVAAASRLHFGLLHVPVSGLSHDRSGRMIRQFGGLGLMVDQPGVVVELSESPEWQLEGSLAERAKVFIQRMAIASPFRIVANGPAEHTGLGVGTTLGMAIAEAISVFNDRINRPGVELAAQCGRGERSGIGVFGFRSGGMIVDLGKGDDEVTSTCQSISFPEEWRIVIALPNVSSQWHGDTERTAFARQRSIHESLATKTRLEELLFQQIVPALQIRDFQSFSQSIAQFNRIAGEPFAADQGGPYATLEITKTVEMLQSWGVIGVGQSSWGPTVFAFAESDRQADWIVRSLISSGINNQSVFVARAASPATTTVVT